MKFIVRPGSDPVARADATLLSAMGMPGGGLARLGSTHVLVRPGEVPDSSAILIGEITRANAGVSEGESVDVTRAMLPQAQRVILDDHDLPLEPRQLARALQGIPVTTGDTVRIDPSYGDNPQSEPVFVKVTEVIPPPAGTVGSGTVVGEAGEEPPTDAVKQPSGRPAGETITTAEALLAGLETELDTMSGWLALLTSRGNVAATWGLPQVAGVLLAGPAGVGKSELVAAAAAAAGARVEEVSLELVFKPERLLDLVEKAVKGSVGPTVIFLDRLDAVAGDEGMFRSQTAAIMRWFLDAVAEKPQTAAVLGVSSIDALDDSIATSPLLPRLLEIPPPDLNRRKLLFQAALGKIPTGEVDYDLIAAKSAGFSGADVMAAVVHASAKVVRSSRQVTTDVMLAAIGETTPSLGSVSLGELPSYGFERVANLTEVKQRLTEAVIWPIQNPERFEAMGIDPPRGLLLYGPPGTGKTYVTRALAHEAGAAFFSIKGAELLDKFVGESERGVRELFARARAVAPSIIFFDEFDALAPIRGNSTNSVTDSVVAALLTEIDGVADRGDVVVVAATNRKDLIDPALLRGGRLETHILLDLPTAEARKALLEITDVPLADDVELDELAAATDGMSFADLTSMLREAALNVLRNEKEELEVTWDDLRAALQRFDKEVLPN